MLTSEPIDYDSPRSIDAFMSRLDIAIRKRWGQNFLINRGAREKIIGLLSLTEGEAVWEIGPGLGAMTDLALAAGAKVTAFEIDSAYQIILKEIFEKYGDKFEMVGGDALKTLPLMTAGPVKILGNLPYNMAAAIIKLLPATPFTAAVLTVQREAALRMVASPGGKEYSSFSLWCQSRFDMSYEGTLKPGSFYPHPRVDSGIIKLTPGHKLSEKRLRVFDFIIRASFAGRRKTLRNNLKSICMTPEYDLIDSLGLAGIDQGARGEELALADYLRWANLIYDAGMRV